MSIDAARRARLINIVSFIAVTLLSICFVLALGNVPARPLESALKAQDNGDYQTALQLLQPLAERGDPQAELQIGTLYLWGHGIPRDDTEAVRWFRASAEQGYGPAQVTLGRMYVAGNGVPKDMVQAYMWFSLAVGRMGPEASAATEARERTAARMSPHEIAEGQRLANEWKPKPAPLRNP
jgi:TPR repeat protein